MTARWRKAPARQTILMLPSFECFSTFRAKFQTYIKFACGWVWNTTGPSETRNTLEGASTRVTHAASFPTVEPSRYNKGNAPLDRSAGLYTSGPKCNVPDMGETRHLYVGLRFRLHSSCVSRPEPWNIYPIRGPGGRRSVATLSSA